jgi:hypothetical protein
MIIRLAFGFCRFRFGGFDFLLYFRLRFRFRLWLTFGLGFCAGFCPASGLRLGSGSALVAVPQILAYRQLPASPHFVQPAYWLPVYCQPAVLSFFLRRLQRRCGFDNFFRLIGFRQRTLLTVLPVPQPVPVLCLWMECVSVHHLQPALAPYPAPSARQQRPPAPAQQHRSGGGAHVFSGSSGSSCVLRVRAGLFTVFLPALTGIDTVEFCTRAEFPPSDRSDALSLFLNRENKPIC